MKNTSFAMNTAECKKKKNQMFDFSPNNNICLYLAQFPFQ